MALFVGYYDWLLKVTSNTLACFRTSLGIGTLVTAVMLINSSSYKRMCVLATERKILFKVSLIKTVSW